MIVGSLCLTLVGCSPGVINLEPKASTPDCNISNLGPEPLPVAILNRKTPLHCDMANTWMRFPDGQEFNVPKWGTGAGFGTPEVGHPETDVEYTWDNLAQYGVVVSRKVGDKPRQWWGSPEGIAKEKESNREIGVK